MDYTIAPTRLWLSCERYTNAGLTQQEMKEIAARVVGVLGVKDHCINSNIEVSTWLTDRELLDILVTDINVAFYKALRARLISESKDEDFIRIHNLLA